MSAFGNRKKASQTACAAPSVKQSSELMKPTISPPIFRNARLRPFACPLSCSILISSRGERSASARATELSCEHASCSHHRTKLRLDVEHSDSSVSRMYKPPFLFGIASVIMNRQKDDWSNPKSEQKHLGGPPR